MEVMQHTYTLKEAWRLTRRYKKLWFLGLFASFFGSGVMDTIFIAYDNLSNSGERLQALLKNLQGVNVQTISMQLIHGFQESTPQFIVWLLLVGLFLLTLVASLWFIAMTQTALIQAIPFMQQGKTFLLRRLFSGIQKTTGKILILHAISGGISLMLLLLSGFFFTKIMPTKEYSLLVLLLFLFIFLFSIILHLFLSVLSLYASGAIVLYHKSLKEGIKESVKIFRENWEITIETAFRIFVIQIIASLAAILLVVIFSTPFALLLVLSVSTQHFLLVSISLMSIGFIITAGMMLFRAIFTTYQTTCWMLLYQYLPKTFTVRRLFHRLAQR